MYVWIQNTTIKTSSSSGDSSKQALANLGVIILFAVAATTYTHKNTRMHTLTHQQRLHHQHTHSTSSTSNLQPLAVDISKDFVACSRNAIGLHICVLGIMDIRRGGSERARAQKPSAIDADAIAMRRAASPPHQLSPNNVIKFNYSAIRLARSFAFCSLVAHARVPPPLHTLSLPPTICRDQKLMRFAGGDSARKGRQAIDGECAAKENLCVVVACYLMGDGLRRCIAAAFALHFLGIAYSAHGCFFFRLLLLAILASPAQQR